MTIAHQGGWDEIAIFAVPVLMVLWLLRWAERRSRSVDVTEVEGGGDPGVDGGEERDQRAGKDTESG